MEPSTLNPLYVDSELDIAIMALFTLLFFTTTMQVYSSSPIIQGGTKCVVLHHKWTITVSDM